MEKVMDLYVKGTGMLDNAGHWGSMLVLRLLMAWEFGESGFEKFYGENWFWDLKFPFPFNILSPEVSWFISTWFEIIGAFALVLGLFTRFFSISLIVLSIVAIASVHWPEHWETFGDLLKGYAITDRGFGNYKLPLMFIIILIPLFLTGPGKASLDYFLRKKFLGR